MKQLSSTRTYGVQIEIFIFVLPIGGLFKSLVGVCFYCLIKLFVGVVAFLRKRAVFFFNFESERTVKILLHFNFNE